MGSSSALQHKQDPKSCIKPHIEQEKCTFKHHSGSQGKKGNSQLTDFLVRLCGDLLPGVGFQVVGVDLGGKKRSHEILLALPALGDAATGSDPL